MEKVRTALKWDQRSELVKTLFLLAVVVIATFGGYGIFMLSMGTTSPLVVVTSESMEPALYPGDLLILQGRPAEDIAVGDIIVYEDDWHGSAPIVHRVVSIEVENGNYYYFTQGDNNAIIDPGNRTYDEVVGVMILRIPAVGHLSLFLRTPLGIATTAVIFVLILVVPEFACHEEEETAHGTPNGGTESSKTD
ncbi:MAG: signal peptidase I [Candidatus Lokiarchaeota archaeon]|nr:signal peptidase I [Candidatus Lokiarchaeota archaeon]